jgi:serine/threonine-protein kinase
VSDDSVTVTRGITGQIQTWGSLQILQEIGHGGFGVVYRAWEPALTREVALKIIRPREPNPDALAAILREGQLLARVRHPNVVTVYGAQQIGNEVGLWMELVNGRSLSDLVKRDGPRAAAEAAVIGISLCQATAAVHQAGVLHRDIKAHNVMREAGGRIVLMDFGAGQLLAAPRGDDERTTGTPAYMAPEVLAGGRASARSDIYSLGILLYYLVTGTYPVDGNTWTDFLLAHARFERRPLADVRPDIEPGFVRIVERATALNPDERYATPGAMLADLNTIATGRGVQVRGGGSTAKRASPGGSESRRRRAVVVRRRRSVWPIVFVSAAPFVGPLALGGLASAAFNQTVGRTAEFAQESLFGWWVWGLKALLPGAVYVVIVVLFWWLLAAAWRVVRRVWAPAERFAAGTARRLRAAAARAGLNEPEAATQALVAAQTVALAIFCWNFRDMFGAFISFIDTAPFADMAPLDPKHLERHQMYNLVMALMILAMCAGAYRVAAMRRRAAVKPSASLAAVFAGIGFSFVLLTFPYRLIWHNDFPTATHDGARCYVLGQESARALLYCPDAPPPRVKVVGLPDVKDLGPREKIYTRVDRSEVP